MRKPNRSDFSRDDKGRKAWNKAVLKYQQWRDKAKSAAPNFFSGSKHGDLGLKFPSGAVNKAKPKAKTQTTTTVTPQRVRSVARGTPAQRKAKAEHLARDIKSGKVAKNADPSKKSENPMIKKWKAESAGKAAKLKKLRDAAYKKSADSSTNKKRINKRSSSKTSSTKLKTTKPTKPTKTTNPDIRTSDSKGMHQRFGVNQSTKSKPKKPDTRVQDANNMMKILKRKRWQGV